jgi:molybdate-binding protein
MFKLLLQRILDFVKLYQEKQDITLLVECEKVQEYKLIIEALAEFHLKDL